MHLRLPLVTWPLSFGVLLGGADAQGKDGLAGALISEPLLVNGQEISNSLAKRLLIYSSADLRAYYARALVLKSVEVDTLDWSRRWGDLPVVGFEEPPPRGGGVGERYFGASVS
jgi:ABC-type sulfate transport system permease subunit